jgi:hypothetical protein
MGIGKDLSYVSSTVALVRRNSPTGVTAEGTSAASPMETTYRLGRRVTARLLRTVSTLRT